ncbi:hypothetical protein HYR99_37340 [Candidatus Poribacteria bacterium]|nr:hypothetical protein [Candidatus Poribacteria bacterium]
MAKFLLAATAAPVAAISVLRAIHSKYHQLYGVNIKTVFNYLYGPDQISDINRDDSFDFLIAVDSPFYITGKSHARKYRQLFPIHWDANFAVRRRASSPRLTRQILFCPGTSADEQLRVTSEIVTAEPKDVDFSDLSRLINDLDEGQSILSWDPIASTLAQHPFLEKEFGMEYKAWRSLYCHRRLCRQQTFLQAFVNVFVAEWNYYWSQPQEVVKNLLDDKEFLFYFASAALNERIPKLK